MGCSSSSPTNSGGRAEQSPAPGSNKASVHAGSKVHVDPYSRLSKVTLDKRDQAILRAEQLFAATAGKKFHSNYVRVSLVSYGASCKVLTAWHRGTNKKYAAKAIPKVRVRLRGAWQGARGGQGARARGAGAGGDSSRRRSR